jgi:hypothetical protein
MPIETFSDGIARRRAYRRSARYLVSRLPRLICIYDLTQSANVVDVDHPMSLRHLATNLEPNSMKTIAEGSLATLHVDWVAHTEGGSFGRYHLSDLQLSLARLCIGLSSLDTLSVQLGDPQRCQSCADPDTADLLPATLPALRCLKLRVPFCISIPDARNTPRWVREFGRQSLERTDLSSRCPAVVSTSIEWPCWLVTPDFCSVQAPRGGIALDP